MNPEPRAKIAEALRRECGNLSATARRLKMRRVVLKEKVDSDADLTAILHDVREELLDTAENNIYQDVMSQDQRATMFVLRTLGRGRGYVTGTELSSDPARPVHIDGHITFVGVSPQPREDEAA
jgi:hypothetical protein